LRKGFWNTQHSIQTGSVTPEEIRNTIAEFIPQRSTQNETFIESLIRLLKL
jgi:hypothetical protein